MKLLRWRFSIAHHAEDDELHTCLLIAHLCSLPSATGSRSSASTRGCSERLELSCVTPAWLLRRSREGLRGSERAAGDMIIFQWPKRRSCVAIQQQARYCIGKPGVDGNGSRHGTGAPRGSGSGGAWQGVERERRRPLYRLGGQGEGTRPTCVGRYGEVHCVCGMPPVRCCMS